MATTLRIKISSVRISATSSHSPMVRRAGLKSQPKPIWHLKVSRRWGKRLSEPTANVSRWLRIFSQRLLRSEGSHREPVMRTASRLPGESRPVIS